MRLNIVPKCYSKENQIHTMKLVEYAVDDLHEPPRYVEFWECSKCGLRVKIEVRWE